MKGLNFATAEEVNEMAKENVRLKQSNTKLRKQLQAKEEENAKLNKALELKGVFGLNAMTIIERKALETENAKLKELVGEQANDAGLWFQAKTAPEAYLQNELRKLHRMIEASGTK